MHEHLPDERPSITTHLEFTSPEGDIDLYVICELYEDGRLGGVMLGSRNIYPRVRGPIDAVLAMISIGLQHGIPLEEFLSKLIGMKFLPSGRATKAPDGLRDENGRLPKVGSTLDFIAKYLSYQFPNGVLRKNV